MSTRPLTTRLRSSGGRSSSFGLSAMPWISGSQGSLVGFILKFLALMRPIVNFPSGPLVPVMFSAENAP